MRRRAAPWCLEIFVALSLVFATVGCQAEIALAQSASNGLSSNSTRHATEATPPTFVGTIFNVGGVAPLTPNATALANDGTLYASDEGGLRIVRVDPNTGSVTSVSPASNGWSHPSGLHLEADQRHLLVADKDHNRIVEIDVTTGAVTRVWGGPGSRNPAELNAPEDMTMDAGGFLYINDTYHYRVMKIDQTNKVMWTQSSATGTGPGCDGSPIMRNRGVTVGSDGMIYIADTDEARVVALDPSTGRCVRVLGGRNTALALGQPRGVDSDGNGGLWVTENTRARIHHITLTGTSIWASPTTFGSGSCPARCQFRSPHGVQFVPGSSPNTGTIFVSDTYNYRIVAYSQRADGSAAFASYVAEPYPTGGGFNGPFGVAYDPSGRLYVVDHYNNRVEQFDSSGIYVGQIGGSGVRPGSFDFPRGIVVMPSSSTTWPGAVLVCDSENNRLQVFTQASFSPGGFGTPPLAVLTPNGTSFLRPQQIFLSPIDGSLWVADTNNHRILDLSLADGTVKYSWAAAGNPRPAGVAVDGAGNVYVTGTNLSEYTSTGTLRSVVAAPGDLGGAVSSPDGMAVDGSGTLYVADTGNNRVEEFDLVNGGAYLQSFGTAGTGDGQFEKPYMVALGPSGQIAVSDFGNNRVSTWKA